MALVFRCGIENLKKKRKNFTRPKDPLWSTPTSNPSIHASSRKIISISSFIEDIFLSCSSGNQHRISINIGIRFKLILNSL
jgi:hypothetical protein